MAVDDQSLLIRKLSRLGQHLEGNTDLADIVEQPGHAESSNLTLRASEALGQSHGQHGDIERVRGGVLIEFLQLQQRKHDSPLAVHRHRERPDDGFRFDERNAAMRFHLVLQPSERLHLFTQRYVQCGERGCRRRRFLLRLTLNAHRPKADTERPHLPVLARRDDRQCQPGEDLLEKALELVTADLAFELEALDAGGDKPMPPVPFLEVPQPIPAVHDLAIQERERRTRGRFGKPVERLICGVNRATPRRMSVGIQRHDSKRLRERIEETDRVAHARTPPAAWRSSGSEDPRASASMSLACGSVDQTPASACTAAKTIGVGGADFGLPSMLLPPSTRCRRASRAARSPDWPSARTAWMRSSSVMAGCIAMYATIGVTARGHRC